jgi:hypothetical protein
MGNGQQQAGDQQLVQHQSPLKSSGAVMAWRQL